MRSLQWGQSSDVYCKICSERHYTSIVADISSDVQYFVFTVYGLVN